MSSKRHAFRPSPDRLEAHVVLSSFGTGSAIAASGSPIVETLTTDKTVYTVGQPIHITLTETNTTNTSVVSANMKQGGGFVVSRHFKPVWKSPRARLAATSFTLQPGQTHTFTVTWNGHPNIGSLSRSTPVTGTVQIDNTLANNTVSIAIDPAHGKGSHAGVTGAVPDVTLSLVD
jgi:hypothetical protein